MREGEESGMDITRERVVLPGYETMDAPGGSGKRSTSVFDVDAKKW